MAPTLLFVDDEPTVVDSMVRLFGRRLEASTVAANSGREAIEVLERQPVDLVLTDYRMPDVDGLGVLEAARRLQPDARRALFTAYAEPAALREASGERLTHDIFAKDIDMEELLGRLQTLLMPEAASKTF